MQKVAILGTGAVGQALAGGFRKNGYDVVMGTAHPDKQMEWQDSSLSDISLHSYAEAAKQSEPIVLTVKGFAAEEVARSIASDLAGKVVIDTTNPIAEKPPVNGVISYFTTHDESLMERLQKVVPLAKFVKAFNSIGNVHMVDPKFAIKPTMFICGNDDEAKKEVTKILDLFGWETADMGFAEAARAIEPLAMLWCIPAILRGERNHAFKFL